MLLFDIIKGGLGTLELVFGFFFGKWDQNRRLLRLRLIRVKLIYLNEIAAIMRPTHLHLFAQCSVRYIRFTNCTFVYFLSSLQ